MACSCHNICQTIPWTYPPGEKPVKKSYKGSLSITDFVYFIKARSDELAVLGAPMDTDDLTEQILDGLGEDYTELVRAVQAREAAISFDELHEASLV
jgi:hypothetical protein